MAEYTLSINPTIDGTGEHDPSAVLFEDGRLVFGVEEERYTRDKHALHTFPSNAIRACLDYRDIELDDVDRVLIPWQPESRSRLSFELRDIPRKPTVPSKLQRGFRAVKNYATCLDSIEAELAKIGSPVPPIRTYNHHRCHAASAFYPSGFDEALILTVDGRGDRNATVVWKANRDDIQPVREYRWPNTLGGLYSGVTEFLGFRANNGEGKVMGLAPYGESNPAIRNTLLDIVDVGVEYDVTGLVRGGPGAVVERLEDLFGRPAKSAPVGFTDWEKDLAYVTQNLLEMTVLDIVETYCERLDVRNVSLAGGVALNCKTNKRVMESDLVEHLFVQPVAHDAGTAIGAGMLDTDGRESPPQSTVYWGPEFSSREIRETLDRYKIRYSEPENVAQTVAERIANGDLVGWFQGRLEMGPRALGNRSILADPRTAESRDRVNEFVKHREEWRPFAPSVLEEALDEYVENAEPSSYMIKTFDVKPDRRDEIEAVLHPGDDTTRPQTVREDQNPRYYELLREFERITGVPVVLNTSFNDHGEPIVTTPTEAVKDFFGMGLDLLVLEDLLVEKDKEVRRSKIKERSEAV